MARFHRTYLVAWSMMVMVCRVPAWAAAPADAPVALGQVQFEEFPNFGVKLAAPAGWTRMEADKYKTIARWARLGSTPQQMTGLIMVEGARPNATLEKTAEAMAKSWGGVVSPDVTELDGVKALRVTAEAGTTEVRPVCGILAMHDDCLYMLMGGAVKGESIDAAIEAVRQNWKWVDIQPVGKCLTPPAEPSIVFGGTVSIRYPKAMHTYPTKTPDSALDLALTNLKKNAPDMVASVQLAPKDPKVRFPDLCDAFLKGMQTKNPMEPAPVWQKRKGPTERVQTQTVLVTVPNPPGKKAAIRWALIELDPSHVVLINFTLDTQTKEERDACETAIDAIVDSVQPVK